MRSPGSFFTDNGVQAKPFSPFSMAKGFNFAKGMSLFVARIKRNVGHQHRDGSSVSEERSTSNGVVVVAVVVVVVVGCPYFIVFFFLHFLQ